MKWFDLTKIWETIIAILLALAGGITRLLSLKKGEKLGWGTILAQLFMSGFTGLMILYLSRAIGLTDDWIGFFSGISGFLGVVVLELAAKKYLKLLGIDYKNDHTKTNKEKK